MILALLVTIAAIFTMQTITNRYSNQVSSQNKLAGNEANIVQLTEILGQADGK